PSGSGVLRSCQTMRPWAAFFGMALNGGTVERWKSRSLAALVMTTVVMTAFTMPQTGSFVKPRARSGEAAVQLGRISSLQGRSESRQLAFDFPERQIHGGGV